MRNNPPLPPGRKRILSCTWIHADGCLLHTTREAPMYRQPGTKKREEAPDLYSAQGIYKDRVSVSQQQRDDHDARFRRLILCIYSVYASGACSGFRHVMMVNLMSPFLYPSIISGTASAPLMALIPVQIYAQCPQFHCLAPPLYQNKKRASKMFCWASKENGKPFLKHGKMMRQHMEAPKIDMLLWMFSALFREL